jgi:hypothetical protein
MLPLVLNDLRFLLLQRLARRRRQLEHRELHWLRLLFAPQSGPTCLHHDQSLPLNPGSAWIRGARGAILVLGHECYLSRHRVLFVATSRAIRRTPPFAVNGCCETSPNRDWHLRISGCPPVLPRPGHQWLCDGMREPRQIALNPASSSAMPFSCGASSPRKSLTARSTPRDK